MKKREAFRGDNKTVSYGFVGRWINGTLGWCMPTCLSGTTDWPDKPKQEPLKQVVA